MKVGAEQWCGFCNEIPDTTELFGGHRKIQEVAEELLCEHNGSHEAKSFMRPGHWDLDFFPLDLRCFLDSEDFINFSIAVAIRLVGTRIHLLRQPESRNGTIFGPVFLGMFILPLKMSAAGARLPKFLWLKKVVRDRLNRLRGGLPSPKKAIKRVASVFTPRKLRHNKKGVEYFHLTS
ncbi:hypothetical protein B0H19DRAFT_1081355 [Mycena capillaripes]|nr:hypothetical protein B0H19DRAFT_1081201 [Mycena capillaripes]KAJ6533191.1 hypothetical protein B0H19DRAFT_1081355 [Mycena capillaripes]